MNPGKVEYINIDYPLHPNNNLTLIKPEDVYSGTELLLPSFALPAVGA